MSDSEDCVSYDGAFECFDPQYYMSAPILPTWEDFAASVDPHPALAKWYEDTPYWDRLSVYLSAANRCAQMSIAFEDELPPHAFRALQRQAHYERCARALLLESYGLKCERLPLDDACYVPSPQPLTFSACNDICCDK